MTTISRRQFHVGFAGLAAFAATGFVPSRAFAQGGGTLRLAISQPAGDLNPHAYNGVWGVQSMIFEPLVAYAKGGAIVPALAESWDIAPDGLTYTFKLRPGVTFHDGTPWNAEAAKWNLDRWIGIEDNNWIVLSMNWAATEIVDDMTVAINLKAPVPIALYELASVRPMRFLSPASVGADGAYVAPIGTGPWAQVSSDDSRTVLKRNDSWWGEKLGVEQVEIITIGDGGSRAAAIQAGDIDLTGGDFFAPVSPAEALSIQAGGAQIVTETGTGTFLLCFNPKRAATQSQAVREAISRSIDRAAVAQVIYGGFATAAGSFFPETIPHAGQRIEPFARDVEAAKSLLEADGWIGSPVRAKDGVALNLELVASEEAAPGSRALAEVVQQQLADIGIAVSIRSVDHAQRHDDIPAGNYDLAFFFTIGAPYDPHSTLTNYFLSFVDNGADGKMWDDATNLDPLVLAAVQSDEATRDAKYQAVYDYLAAGSIVAPLVYTPRIWAVGSRVQGFSMPATEYDVPFLGITVA